MIFYFSGTGNSRAVAEIVADSLGDTAIDIVGRSPSEFQSLQEEYLGFVFPVYAWAAPEVMLRFAEGLEAGEAYTFGIATFSNVAGMALQHFSDVLPLKGGFGLRMPDNYPITDHIIDTKETSMEKLHLAAERLPKILAWVRKKEERFDVEMGENARENSYEKSPVFNEKWRKTAPYHVGDACIGCGICERKCPAEAIRMKEGKPVWVKEDCYLCMACLNYCPTEAIDYGPHSKGRFRYYFKGFSPENY